jgi:uncharacterized protein (DUF58 family)
MTLTDDARTEEIGPLATGEFTVVEATGAASATAAKEAAESAARLTRRFVALVERRTGLTRSGLVLVGLIVVSWVLGKLIAGRPLYLLAYAAAALLVIFRLAFNRPPAITAIRSQPVARVSERAEVKISVMLTAERNVSTLLVEEHIPPLLGASARIPIAELAGGSSAEYRYAVTAWRRGVYQMGPLMVRWGDPFGLTQRQAELTEQFELIVHPTIEPLVDRPLTRMWEDPPMRPPISKPWPSGLEFYGMRPYQPGDDVRNIVWRAYARTRTLLVREAEQGISDKVIILLDDNRRFHSKGLISESFEEAVRAAASIGVHHLNQGYVVTLELNAARLLTALRVGPTKVRLLDELARMQMSEAKLSTAIARLNSEGTRDAHLLVITPYLEPESAARLEPLIERGMQVTVVALVWDEEHTVALARASALGAKVVEVRPNTPLSVGFRREIGGTGHR